MGRRMITLLISLAILFSLTSCNSHWKSVDASSFLPVKQFLFIHKKRVIGVCSGDFCSETSSSASGSGFVVGQIEEGSFAITAAHVCTSKKIKRPAGLTISSHSELRVITFRGQKYPAKILTFDQEIDICMLFVEGLVDIKPVELAREAPKVGDKIYNIGAPVAFFEPGMTSILEGRFAGNSPSRPWALYSLPAAGGSSGSMILNYRGRLLGVLHSVHYRFHHITLATTYDDTLKFINKKLNYYLTYKNNMEVLNLPDIFKIKQVKKTLKGASK